MRQRSGVRCALELDCGTPADAAPHGVAAQLTADDAVTLFTAGTTGRAKIVPQTHANVAASLHGIMTTYELGPGEATVAAMPFFHGHGLVAGLLATLGTVARTLERLLDAPVLSAYGMTEIAHQAAGEPLSASGDRAPGSVGRATTGHIRVLATARRECAAGTG
ncbi:AMP-binding protein [Streptomyces mexicanus]|uniref:AMP-binding protein n=1 Tax=Streptomyces mexicanus TaxID=178566 RepID=UPI0036C9BB1B